MTKLVHSKKVVPAVEAAMSRCESELPCRRYERYLIVFSPLWSWSYTVVAAAVIATIADV